MGSQLQIIKCLNVSEAEVLVELQLVQYEDITTEVNLQNQISKTNVTE